MADKTDEVLNGIRAAIRRAAQDLQERHHFRPTVAKDEQIGAIVNYLRAGQNLATQQRLSARIPRLSRDLPLGIMAPGTKPLCMTPSD